MPRLRAILIAWVSALPLWLIASEPPLRVVTSQDALTFEPGEEFQFEVETIPAVIGAGIAFDLTVALAPGGGGDLLWRGETKRVEAPSEGPAKASVTVPLPNQEGVYRVVLRATRTSGFTNRFIGGPKTLAEREFQVLVFDPNREVGAPESWREEYSFNPASPRWRDRLDAWADWRRLPWIDHSAMSSLPGGARRDSTGRLMVLPPAPDQQGAHWQAYTLPNDRPGEARVVEVEWPVDAQQQLAFALYDRTSDGRLQPLCEPVVVESPRWGKTDRRRTRLVVWPQTREPLLLVANPHPTAEARFGRIRLLAPEGRIARTTGQRLVALDWGRSSLLASVGLASDDLLNRYVAASRIADRVQLAGATGAVLDVSPEDLAAIVYDEKPAPDLPRIGTLDLLLAEFDRRGLRLLPALRFNTPLSGIEAVRARADSGAGWEWIDQRGEKHPGCVYSPLHPRVAEEMITVANQLVQRSAKHGSFAGLAIRLGEDSSTLLAGDAWGYDADTVDRFLATQGLQWPPGASRDPAAHEASLRNSKEIHTAWRHWRYEQLTALYGKIAKQTIAAKPGGLGLLLTSEDLATRPGIRQALAPRLGAESMATGVLQAHGVTPPPGMDRLLPVALPRSHTLHEPLTEISVARSVNDGIQASLLESQGEETTRCLTIVSEPQEVRLIQAARALGLSGVEELSLAAHPVSEGNLAAAFTAAVAWRESVCLLETGAACGGLLDDDATQTRRLVAGLSESPVLPETNRGDSHEVVLRVLPDENASTLVLINPSPWPCAATVTVEAVERALATPLASDEGAVWCEAGRHALATDLPPYSMRAWRFSSPKVNAMGVRTQPRPEAEDELRAVLSDIQSRDRTATRAYSQTPNPSFESLGETGQPNLWTVDPTPEVVNTSPEGGAAAGAHALRLKSGQSAVCDPFPQPATGQYVLFFQARGAGLDEDSTLRLDIASTDNTYQVHTLVQAGQLEAGTESLAWRPVIFGIDDLPLDEAAELQIRFTLTGPGEVWIDDLRSESLILPVEAYSEQLRGQKFALVKMIHSAENALEEGRLVRCRELLDSYWLRFVAEYFPEAPQESTAPESDQVALGEEPDTAGEPSEQEDSNPSMTQRLKGWFWR